MFAAAFRLASFVALAAAAAALWVGVFRSTANTVTATPAIPSFSSKSIFAPAARTTSGIGASHLVRNGACRDCVVHVGSGGLVRARVPSGAGRRTAYALLDLGRRTPYAPVLVHDVIGFGRGETPARPVRLLQVLDSSRRVIFELVAEPDRQLLLTSPPGGLRAGPLVLGTGALVPNDGVAGVAVDVALKPNGWIVVSVNGMQTAAKRGLTGARTGAPRYLAAGVIDYRPPSRGAGITATHAQVSVSTSPAPAPAPQVAAPAAPPASPAQAAKPSAPPTPQAPATPSLSSLAPPTISGRELVGRTLTADPGTWSNAAATFTYAWERCADTGSCTGIGGADGKTYDLVAADRGAFVRVRVTAHAGGAGAAKTSALVGPILPEAPTSLEAPQISGRAVEGAQLQAHPGGWSDPGATFSFAWQRCDGAGTCATIDGATDTTYTVSAADVGSSLRVEVTAANDGGANTADSSPTDVVVRAAPTVVTAPSVSGDAVVGSTLTADPGAWSDPAATLTFAWQRCEGSGTCTAIDGADGKTYTVSGADVGSSLRVEVTAANDGGANTADSAPTDAVVPAAPAVVTDPSLSGDAIVGSTLTADPGTWSDPAATFTFVWQRCDDTGSCTTIDGADGAKYVLRGADAGFWIEVTVTAANAGGTGTATSNLIGPVVLPAPPTLVSAPSVTGDPVVGSPLIADPGAWTDPAAAFTYAWLRCDDYDARDCTTIDGADGASFVVRGDDAGFWVGFTVTAANAGGTGVATSNLVGPVVLPGHP